MSRGRLATWIAKVSFSSKPENDNATPVKALSLDVERWFLQQRGIK